MLEKTNNYQKKNPTVVPQINECVTLRNQFQQPFWILYRDGEDWITAPAPYKLQCPITYCIKRWHSIMKINNTSCNVILILPNVLIPQMKRRYQLKFRLIIISQYWNHNFFNECIIFINLKIMMTNYWPHCSNEYFSSTFCSPTQFHLKISWSQPYICHQSISKNDATA